MSAQLEEVQAEETTQVVDYNITDAALAELKDKYSKVPDATTDEGYEAIKAGLKVLLGTRQDVEAKRKDLKADAIAWGKKVDAEAKRITSVIVDLETPMKDAKKEVDDRIKAEKEAKRNAEANRIKAIQEKIDAIKATANLPVGSDSVKIAQAITNLKTVEIDDSYAEFAEDAQHILTSSIRNLQAALEERTRFEQQQEEMERQRKEMEEQQAKLREEQEKLQAAKDKAEQERREAEQIALKAEQEKAAAIKAENDRLAREAEERRQAEAKAQADAEAEAQRKLEMSDGDKLKEYMRNLMNVPAPSRDSLETAEAIELIDWVTSRLEAIQEQVHLRYRAEEPLEDDVNDFVADEGEF